MRSTLKWRLPMWTYSSLFVIFCYTRFRNMVPLLFWDRLQNGAHCWDLSCMESALIREWQSLDVMHWSLLRLVGRNWYVAISSSDNLTNLYTVNRCIKAARPWGQMEGQCIWKCSAQGHLPRHPTWHLFYLLCYGVPSSGSLSLCLEAWGGEYWSRGRRWGLGWSGCYHSWGAKYQGDGCHSRTWWRGPWFWISRSQPTPANPLWLLSGDAWLDTYAGTSFQCLWNCRKTCRKGCGGPWYTRLRRIFTRSFLYCYIRRFLQTRSGVSPSGLIYSLLITDLTDTSI